MVELLEEELVNLNLGSKDHDHGRLSRKKARAKKVKKLVCCLFENVFFQESGQVEPADVCADASVERERPDKRGQDWQERGLPCFQQVLVLDNLDRKYDFRSSGCLANLVASASTRHLV